MKKNNILSPHERLRELIKEFIVVKDINVNGEAKDSFDYQIIKSAHKGIEDMLKELSSADEFIKSLLKDVDKLLVCVVSNRSVKEDVYENAYISYRLLDYIIHLDKREISETDSILIAQMFKDNIKDKQFAIRINEAGLIKAPNERLRIRFREHNMRIFYQIKAMRNYINIVEGR